LYSFFNFCARWGGWSTPPTGRFTHGIYTPYLLYRRMGRGAQSRSRRCGKYRPYRDSIPGPPRLQRVAIPTELPWSTRLTIINPKSNFNPCFLSVYLNDSVGRDSSVGIGTRYGLDGPGIAFRCWRDFPHPSRPALGSYPASCTTDTEFPSRG
jgi:hypothetical protein